MDNLQGIGKTKRQKKNEETRQKLCKAMERIMNEYDYNTVTIRNICKVAEVAYGSFYNLFDSKEAFLMYYLTHDFTQYMEQYYLENQEFDKLSCLEKSVDIFVCCARYNVEKGLKFIRAFYSPDNDSLFPDMGMPEKDYSFTPLMRQGREYLKKAKENGELNTKADIEKMIHMYCYLFNGITFNWCLSKGNIDVVGLTQKMLTGCIREENLK